MPPGFNESRARLLTPPALLVPEGDCVLYWMSRDQRVHDNHALACAQGVAQAQGLLLRVVFNLVPTFLQATERQFYFMLKGLQEVEAELRRKQIPFHLLRGSPSENVPRFAQDQRAVCVVTDFSPLRVPLGWVQTVAVKLQAHIPVVQVDAHNIVPVWEASEKQEHSARTIRPKITGKLQKFLHDEAPTTQVQTVKGALDGVEEVDWEEAMTSLMIDRTVKEVAWCKPGEAAATQAMHRFLSTRLRLFDTHRNDPNVHACSDLSPYFHFGQLSVARVLLEMRKAKKSSASFVEEAVVRRELSDNFCFYNPHYDSLEGCYGWARDSLQAHAKDAREHTYTRPELEAGQTHDALWNAAQQQLVVEGKMHGFLRMYWAKKVLEWTASPETALATAIHLNDRFSLDGRDPNGYVGCMWSIGGIHDQGWREREVFGKVRYMNYQGCVRKFDVPQFVQQYSEGKSARK